MARRGRRPGPTVSREAILDAARRRFAAAGYAATSLRAIAAEAGVDPGVVLHFFGSKQGLFRAVIGWPFDPAELRSRIAAPGADGLEVRLAQVFLSLWEDPATRASLTAVLRSAMTEPQAADLLREFAVAELLGQLLPLLEGEQRELRLTLAAAQMIGFALLRYVVAVEPLASADIETLLTWLPAALRPYLRPGDVAGS
jgi:AcrR family transcriptional regulator